MECGQNSGSTFTEFAQPLWRSSTLVAPIPSGWNLIWFDSRGLCVDAIAVKPIQRVVLHTDASQSTRMNARRKLSEFNSVGCPFVNNENTSSFDHGSLCLSILYTFQSLYINKCSSKDRSLMLNRCSNGQLIMASSIN